MRILSLSLAAAVAGLSAIVAPHAANACGGFFCAQSAPVVQTGERILFMQLDENTIETHVQISYSGPSEDFAWIVPTPSVPALSLGSDVIFNALNRIGPPIDVERAETIGTCGAERNFGGGTEADAGPSFADAGGGGVRIVALETVGPFDTAIIQATAVEPMMEWLDTNGYDLPPSTAALLSPYVQGEMFFLALKLTKNATSGDLQPIAMTYNASAPMIPIQLTAIAAADDMPVQTWIVGEHFAAPANYAEVEPEPIAILTRGWVSAAQRAIDAVDARSMMRTFADASAPLATRFYNEAYEADLAALRQTEGASAVFGRLNFGELGLVVQANAIRLPSYQFCAPMPERLVQENLSPLQFYVCPQCFVESAAEWTTPGGEACADFVEERLVEPLRRVAAYFTDLSTASRFDTWLDADEMDLDPTFCWDDTLEARETLRATRTMYCREDLSPSQAPVRFDLDGLTFFPDDTGTYVGLSSIATITRHGCGERASEVTTPSDLEPRDVAARQSVARFDEWFNGVEVGEGSPYVDGVAPDDTKSGGCSTSGVAGAWPMLAALLALGAGRRRRR